MPNGVLLPAFKCKPVARPQGTCRNQNDKPTHGAQSLREQVSARPPFARAASGRIGTSLEKLPDREASHETAGDNQNDEERRRHLDSITSVVCIIFKHCMRIIGARWETTHRLQVLFARVIIASRCPADEVLLVTTGAEVGSALLKIVVCSGHQS